MRRIAFFLEWGGYHAWVDSCPLYEKVRSLAGFRKSGVGYYKPADITDLTDSSATVADYWQSRDIRDYQNLTYRSLYLWELCKCSVYDHLMKCSIDDESDHEVIKHYYDKTIHLIDCFDLFYRKNRCDCIVVVQGAQYDMRAAVEAARWHGIDTVAIENSFIRQLVFIDRTSGMICNRHALSRNSWDRIKARCLTAGQEHKLQAFFSSQFTSQVEQDSAISAEEARKKLSIPEDKKIALVVGQVITDAVISMDSFIYKNTAAFMFDTVKLMEKHPDYHVIIRLHPREADKHTITSNKYFDNITLKKLKEMGIDACSNASVVHSYDMNTYSIMEIADFGIVINSQLGLEMLFRKKPVVVLGDAFYARKGFTRDVDSREAFPAVLDAAARNPVVTERQKKDIDNFLYHMVFEYLFPRDLQGCDERLKKIFFE